MIGSFGDITCFSFDGIKNITCGEGGAIVTSDKKVLQRIQDARLLGVERDSEKRYSGQRSWEFDVTTQGYRYHMSNLNAAIGLAQLKKAPTLFSRRQELTAEYHRALSSLDSVILFPLRADHIIAHIYPIRVLNGKRDVLRDYLLKQNIETGIHYFPNHLLTFYGKQKGALPKTEQLYNELLTLPLHPDISAQDQDFIIANVKQGLQEIR